MPIQHSVVPFSCGRRFGAILPRPERAVRNGALGRAAVAKCYAKMCHAATVIESGSAPFQPLEWLRCTAAILLVAVGNANGVRSGVVI